MELINQFIFNQIFTILEDCMWFIKQDDELSVKVIWITFRPNYEYKAMTLKQDQDDIMVNQYDVK